MFQTIFIAVCNMVGSFIGMILFDRYGRIPIMKIGTIGSIIGLLIASYGLYTHDTGYITIFGILFFMLLFAISWSVGAWVLISEVFPEKIKGFGMGLAVSLMWIANFLISLLFPVVNDNGWLQAQFGGAFSMWVFVAFNLVCYFFIARYVPETKGVPLNEIEALAATKLQSLRGKNHNVTA
jgi:MFS family permease